MTGDPLVSGDGAFSGSRPLASIGLHMSLATWLWTTSTLAGGMYAGAVIDAWSHVHMPFLDPVLNAWHLPVYGSFMLLMAALALPSAGRFLRGRSGMRVFPRVTRVPLIGGILFILAGFADTIWHAAFGLEVGVEALLSPSHLALAVGAALLWTAPLQLAWSRPQPASLTSAAPGLISVGLIVGLITFATHFAHPFVDPWPAFRFDEQSATSWFVPSLGFASMVIQTAVVIGASLLLVRQWPDLRRGSLAIVFLVSGLGLPFLHDQPWLIVAPIVGGLVAELCFVLLRPGASAVAKVRLYAALVPGSQALVYLLLIEAVDGVRWSPHLAGGLVAIAALTGAAVSFLAFPPGRPRAALVASGR